MNKYFFSFSLTLLLSVNGCVQESENNDLGGVIDDETEYNEVMSKDTTTSTPKNSDNATLEMYTDKYIDLLHNNDLESFAEYFHPQKGAYFTPYTYFDSTTAVHFSKTQFIQDLNANKVFTWGVYDGSGEPIEFNIKDYFKQFVYNLDFKNLTSNKNVQSKLVSSNTLNNIDKKFPNAKYVEYYYKGTGQYEGMDWSSLIFYVEEYQGQYYIVLVAHNQWTI